MQKRKVLIVDDTASVRSLLGSVLDTADLEIQFAEDGAQAFEMISVEAPDIVLCDLNMPVMSGRELLEKLRHGVKSSKVPFIVLSADNDQKLSQELRELGANEVVDKAGSLPDLLQHVNRLLEMP